MTNRRDYHKRTAKDVKADGRYVRLTEYMLASSAWQALTGNSRALYIELARRYRGPSSNNGKIPYSVREVASALAIGRSTAQRCFEQLMDFGFVKIGKRSGFNMKGRVATEWMLTEFPDDTTSTTGIASKDFMKWTAEDLIHSPAAEPLNSFHSPISDTDSPTSEPGVDLRRDRVAQEERLWPSGGTVSPDITVPQSHHKDTTHLPGGCESDLPEEQRAGEARYPNSAVASPPAATRPSLVPSAPLLSHEALVRLAELERRRRPTAAALHDIETRRTGSA
jgi:hypothetical protein